MFLNDAPIDVLVLIFAAVVAVGLIAVLLAVVWKD